MDVQIPRPFLREGEELNGGPPWLRIVVVPSVENRGARR